MRAISVLMLAFACQLLSAQEKLLPVMHFQSLAHADLPSSATRSRIVRDHQGFIWIGSVLGLSRFDGYGCRLYRAKAGEPNSGQANAVVGLYVDKGNRFWVAPFGIGLALFDAQEERFVYFTARHNDTTWVQTKSLSEFHEDRSGYLWVGSLDGEVVLVDLSAAKQETSIDNIARGVRFRSFLRAGFKSFVYNIEDWDEQSVLVSSNGGLFVINRETGRIVRPNLPSVGGVCIDTVMTTGLCWEGPQRLWIGTAFHGLYLFNRASGVLTVYHKRPKHGGQPIDDRISDLQLDRSGNLWVGTSEGIDLFEPSSGTYKEYLTTTGTQPRSLYTRFSVDSSGILWISILDDAPAFLHPRTFRLPHYGLRAPTGRPLDMGMIDQMNDGSLWVTAEGSVFQLDIDSLKVLRAVDLFTGKEPLIGPHILDSYCDGKKRIWYATGGLGLFDFEPETGHVKTFRPAIQRDQSRNKVCFSYSIAPAGGNALWIARAYEGLQKFDWQTNTWSNVFDGWVTHVTRDSDGKIWASDDQEGLRVVDPGANTFEHFVHDDKDPTSLSGNRTGRIIEDSQRRIWIGAAALDLWEPATRSFKHFTNKAVSEMEYVQPLGTDMQGRIWVAYSSGILGMLDPTTGEFTNVDGSDGACGISGWSDLHLLRDGRVMLTGTSGLNIVHPDSIRAPGPTPPFVFTRLTINDTVCVSARKISASRFVALPYWQNVLEFEFAVIDPGATHRVEYRYRLEGLEDTWLDWNERRFVRYPGLSPGDYVFRVKATNVNGDWPEQEIACPISIAPPLWRSWWAYALYALLSLGLVFTMFRVRLRQLRLRQEADMEHFRAEHLAEVDRLKSRFFANISHEFRTPLTLILGPTSQILERTTEEPTRQKIRLVRKSVHQLLGLVNQLLDLSRVEAGTMTLQVCRGDLVAVLRRIVMSFESWAERKGICLEFSPGSECLNAYFDADKLEKIVNNLLSNALKFTAEGGRVEVRLRASDDEAHIALHDTGCGISEEHLSHIFERFYRVDDTHVTEGTGIGLALARELAVLHHGTISVESTPGKGSVFTVITPIQRSAYRQEEIVDSPQREVDAERVEMEENSEEPACAQAKPLVTGKPVVLVVEDNVDLCAYLREFLEGEYVVHEAVNGRLGFEQAIELVPDIVISDVMMPGMDGMELCRALRQDVRTSHIPIVVLTARAGADSKIEGLEAGADDYVTKPFEARELLARVRNLIEQRRQLRRKFSAGVVLKPGDVSVTSLDDGLLKTVMNAVERNLGDENFGVDQLAQEACLSRRHLGRKLHALTNLTPAEFIQYVRLQRARELLEKNAGSVADVAFQVGFRSHSYFSACFHKRFGILPSEVTPVRSAST